MADHTHLDLCPHCQGLRVTEMTSLGIVDITFESDDGFTTTGPAEVMIGPSPEPCHVKAIEQTVTVASEIAREWWLITPVEPPEQTPIQRALDILRPHLAWDHRYREDR
jgi:hypothetical protein